MAPERFWGEFSLLGPVKDPSTAGDVYSLVMTSFEASSSFVKPSSYLIWLPRYDQVLTGVLPYDGSDKNDTIARIRLGERPFRPTNPSQNEWLQDPVWDVITAGWRNSPSSRCELSAVHHAFLTSNQEEIPKAKPGDMDTQNGRSLATERS